MILCNFCSSRISLTTSPSIKNVKVRMEYAVPSFLITATICHDFDVRPGSKKEPMLLWDVHPMEGLGVAEPNPRGNEVDHTPDVGAPGTDVEVGDNPDEPVVRGKPGSQEVDQLSWDPPQIDMIAGCEHGGVPNPGVEIPVENLVTPSQKQKRAADTVKPTTKPRSNKRRKKEKQVKDKDVCDKDVESGSQQMAVDPLSGDAPHTDEVNVGCEQGGLSNPDVEIPVENPVIESTSSQIQKRPAESNKPVNEARSRAKGGLYGCLSVPDA